jgi:hypothetical protein
MSILAAMVGTVTLIAGLDPRTVQLWAHRILRITRH